MATMVKQGYIHFPDEWEHIESQHVGPFVTKITHRRSDGTTDVSTSRRHRKHFGPIDDQKTKKRPSLFIWRPHVLNWWIAVLFMIGSWHFFFGSVLLLVNYPNSFLIDLIYFTGSFFLHQPGIVNITSQSMRLMRWITRVKPLPQKSGATLAGNLIALISG